MPPTDGWTNERIAELMADLRENSANMAALTARMDEWTQRSDEEHKHHFAEAKDLQQQVSAIREDYLPRGTFKDHEREQREDADRIEAAIGSLKGNMVALMAGVGTVMALVQVGLQVWMK